MGAPLWVAFAAGPLAFGLLALWIGQDMNWDLRNYHYYNPHALLTWRYDLDVAPAQLQSFFNPLVDIPFYLIIRSLPAWFVGFSAGAIHGLNCSLVFLITWRLVEHPDPLRRGLIAIGSAVVGCSAPAFMGELGALVHDSTLSVLVLAAVALLLEAVRAGEADARRRHRLVAIAGLLMGAATGLKLTNAIFALGSALALLLTSSLKGQRVTALMVYGVTGLVGGLLFLAPWMWFLWERFANPLFPFFNHLFASPAAAPSAFRDAQFLPKGLWEQLFWPLIFSSDSLRVWEVKHQDYRFAALWFAGLLYLIGGAWRRVRRPSTAPAGRRTLVDRPGSDFLLLFTLASFVIWMLGYSIYRYLVPLELLAPLVFGLLLTRLGLSGRVLTGLLPVLGIVTIIALHAPNQRRQGWDERYFHVDPSAVTHPDETIVLMLGQSPMSYVIPEFPSGVRFLRPDGNLGLRPGHGLLERILDVLDGHGGPILLLLEAREQDEVFANSIDRLGLSASPDDCVPLETNAPDDLRLCTARKLAAGT